jgi:hypothetical protein
MGTNQSIPSTSEIKDAPVKKELSTSTMNGPKNLKKIENKIVGVSTTATDAAMVVEEPTLISTDEEEEDTNSYDSSEEDEYDSDDDDEYDDEEFDEAIMERRMVLEEARKLRAFADFYYSPEKPVVTDGTACARNYFTRYSAPEQVSVEEEEERDLAMADALALKKLAIDYLHPERPVVVTDSTACGRNYFTRYSAPLPEEKDEDDIEDMEGEYQQIMKDMKHLKMTAEWYLQPEKPVSVDATTYCRNYFTRPSAPEYEDEDSMEERDQVLADMAALKQVADWYMHPEKPVEVDPTACSRNYFTRPSAPEYEDEDSMEERDQVLADMAVLKQVADWYMHPEKPVEVDPTACSRNYFTRPSAPVYEDEDYMEERHQILADAYALKQVADWYFHPEKPVTVDATACARNFFTRHSAPEYEDEDSMEERDQILADAAALKQVADWYLHPEKPVTVDATACARNFFTRPSAPEYEDEDSMEERDQILADAAALKQVALWYLHPEKPITVDATACARNFFTRPSAPTSEEDEERERVLAEAAELKKVADWYLHPEKPVVCDDPCAAGRNFFSRPSAPEYQDEEEMDECDRILSEAMEMKKLADWYLHPEKPVVSDGFACGRNYFSRPSAPEYEEEDDMAEREFILTEAKKLKEVAGWYHHPEKQVVSDGFSSGRNYFTRPSAPEVDTDSEERERILAEAKQLKKVAEWYHCPEKPVEVDSTTCARNYFSRPSAPEQEDEATAEERNLILQEASKLKKVAGWYHHPEAPVNSSIAVTRNFFTRPSAEGQFESLEEEEERARILIDALRLKKFAIDYLHPELRVLSNGNCGRNYFDRPSAPGHADHIHTQGHAVEEEEQSYLREENLVHHDYYHNYDYASHHHHDDDDHSHHTQSDHFEMDEDVFQGFRESLYAIQQQSQQYVPIIKEVEGDEKEGHLSRSPSDVMLFDEAAM